MGKNVKEELKNGDTIYLLHKSKVKDEGTQKIHWKLNEDYLDVIGYLFSFIDIENDERKRIAEDLIAKNAEIEKENIKKAKVFILFSN